MNYFHLHVLHWNLDGCWCCCWNNFNTFKKYYYLHFFRVAASESGECTSCTEHNSKKKESFAITFAHWLRQTVRGRSETVACLYVRAWKWMRIRLLRVCVCVCLFLIVDAFYIVYYAFVAQLLYTLISIRSYSNHMWLPVPYAQRSIWLLSFPKHRLTLCIVLFLLSKRDFFARCWLSFLFRLAVHT